MNDKSAINSCGRRSSIRCESIVPPLGRREVLAGLAGALAFAPAAMASVVRGKIADLANEEGFASALAKSRTGETTTLRGYFAPSLRAGVLFDLFERPAAPCSLCGFFHDAGASVAIVGERLPQGVNMLRAVDVTGEIAVDSRGKAQLIARDIAIV